jgi:hypothetical protein
LQPWIYSRGSYQKLEVPAGMTSITVRAINSRGEVVGYEYDKDSGAPNAVVWRAGGQPRRLLADGWSEAVDISDACVVVGDASYGVNNNSTGMVWERWNPKAGRSPARMART